MNLQEGRVKMVLNVLEKYANFWESNTENQATTESKTKKYWGNKHKWEIANIEQNICVKLFYYFWINMEKHIECSIFRKTFLIIQDGARKIIHTVAFTEISDSGHRKKKNYSSILSGKE